MEAKDFIKINLNEAQEALMQAIDGLSHDELEWRPGPETNSIGFILWHMVRCEDMFVQTVFQQKPQIWESEKWHERLGLSPNPMNIGYGYSVEKLAKFSVPELSDLLGYAEAVRARTLDYLSNLSPERLDEKGEYPILGEAKLGGLMSHLLLDITEHVGQIAYLRGMMRGLDK